MTLGEARLLRGGTAAYVLVRKHAKSLIPQTENKRECFVCGYSKYVEICHIRAISSFPKTAKLDEINSPSNTVLLCPNHHKEFDRGLMEEEFVNKIMDSKRIS